MNRRRAPGGSIVEGVIRILTVLALALTLTLGAPTAAEATAAPTPSPGASTAASATSVATSGGSRIGGTPGQPSPPKPGWVWWVGAAMVVAFGAGGIRLWRNRWLDNPPADNPTD